MRHRLVSFLGTALLAAACGGAATAPAAPLAPTATATPPAGATPAAPPSPSTSPSPAAQAGEGTRFEVLATSQATVRVREQLAGVSAPSDAVLSTNAVSGVFLLKADGTFTADSKITVDLTTLESDRRQRDDFIKRQTLETVRFPTAAFVPLRTTGLALPLPASGSFAFRLVGKMTIHGVERELTFDITAQRRGAELTANGKVTPSIKFADFGMVQPRVFSVLTIEDDIRLEIVLDTREVASA